MSDANARILVTGASGQLGHLVIDELVGQVPADEVVAMVRNPEKAADLKAKGVEVRTADYDDPASLEAAMAGIDRVLLISGSEVGQRVAQHGNVINTAKNAGVKLIGYTSILHADDSPMDLAEEHRATEKLLRESGLPFVLLRNGWYSENYAAAVPMAVANGAHYSCAGDGRISAAPRADYAAAAAAVIASSDNQAGRVYELAGDEAFTMTEFAAEISRQSGKTVNYVALPEEDYKAALVGAGLPEPLAAMMANSEKGASKDALFDDGHQMSALIGRKTVPISETIAQALAQ